MFLSFWKYIIKINSSIPRHLKDKIKIPFKKLLFLFFIEEYHDFDKIVKCYYAKKFLNINQLKSFNSVPCYLKTFKYNLPKRLKINTFHLNYLMELLKEENLDSFFLKGIEILKLPSDGNLFNIFFGLESNYIEEGPLTLVLRRNDVPIYWLSFVFIPSSFSNGTKCCPLIYITRIQGNKGMKENIYNLTKSLKYIEPSFILFKVLESLADFLKIGFVVGVHFKNQSSYNISLSNTELFFNRYDTFWLRNKGIQVKDKNYIVNFPIKSKSIIKVKPNQRERVSIRRKNLDQIYVNSLHFWNEFLICR